MNLDLPNSLESINKRLQLNVDAFNIIAAQSVRSGEVIPNLSLFQKEDVEKNLKRLINSFKLVRTEFVESKKEADNVIYCIDSYIKESEAKYGKTG